MNRIFALLSVVLSCDAGGKTATDEIAGALPAMKSDEKFFGKDYPWDKRPQVDVLHFGHPYPVVQDSGDYDADFVKDENSDNGSWKAQTEYDRLRHQLRKEKKDVAKALSSKTTAEKALRDAVRRKGEAQEKARVASEKKQRAKDEAAAKKREEAMTKGPKKVVEEFKKVFEVPEKLPGGIASPGDVKIATDETQSAMDALEECKKQLAAARENLKKLVKELDEAKKKQRETESSLSTASTKEKELEAGLETLDKSVKSEYQQYLDAREAYLKQQALVAKMEQDIKAAAAKVKAFRDSSDADGGVYPTPTKNGASSSVSLFSTCLIVGLAYVAQ